MKRFKRIIIFMLLITVSLLSLALMGCGDSGEDIYKVNYFNINILDFEESPYYLSSPVTLDFPSLCDNEGIVLFKYNGDTFYHPVKLSQYILNFLASYKLTGNEEYLIRCDLYFDKMLELANFYNGMPFFPYTFDFELHSINDQVMRADWYSGMAQGLILSAFVRMYEITKDEFYKKWADKVFLSISTVRTDDYGKYWVTVVNEDRYLWIEEYPMNEFNYTLNGFIFAIYGLYDFYRINQDNILAKQILYAALTTVYDNILNFRNPGGPSSYCLKHAIPSKSYHRIHIDQLMMLYAMTSEEFFKEVADLFISDFYDY